jgi:hypothetical protein
MIKVAAVLIIAGGGLVASANRLRPKSTNTRVTDATMARMIRCVLQPGAERD